MKMIKAKEELEQRVKRLREQHRSEIQVSDAKVDALKREADQKKYLAHCEFEKGAAMRAEINQVAHKSDYLRH